MLLFLFWLVTSLPHTEALCASTDLTLQPGGYGSAIVDACIAKISTSGLFPSDDQQMLRRIAYVETHFGTDLHTYSDPNNNGGIWQLSSTKYDATKNVAILQNLTEVFGIAWQSTQWSDLRKPFYSALAARLYLEIRTAPLPLASLPEEQGIYWVTNYTASNRTQSDYVTDVNNLVGQGCSINALELFFVIDESSSVGSSNYEQMKRLVHDIVDSFEIGPDDVQVGLLSFSTVVRPKFHLNEHTTKSSVLSAINSLAFFGGGTNTADALDFVRNNAFTEENGARPASEGVPRVVIVITDGESNDFNSTLFAAAGLHNDGYIVFAIGIGGANITELNGIASSPKYVSFINSFDSDLLSALQLSIAQGVCSASPSFTTGETISSTVDENGIQYFNYQRTPVSDGINIELNVTSGTIVLFITAGIQTPNEAFYDATIEATGNVDLYLSSNDFCVESYDTVYIAVLGKSVTNHFNLNAVITNLQFTSEIPSTITEFYGGTVMLNCSVFGNPSPMITWYKGDKQLMSSNNIIIVDTTSNKSYVQSSLTVQSVSSNDQAMYTCIGSITFSNRTLSQVSETVVLNVDNTGVVIVNFTGIALSSTSIYLTWALPPIPNIANEYRYYIVHCCELLTPREWSFFAVEPHALIVSLHPYYSTVCRVAIRGNTTTFPYSNTITVQTHQEAPSAAPQDPTGSIESPTELNFTWSPPPMDQQNGLILYYVIAVTEVDTGVVSELTSNTTLLYLDYLHPYYTYTFRIAAVTIAQGPFSNNYTLMMPEDVPNASPNVTTISAITSISFTLEWNPLMPEDQNGIIRSYEISIIEIDTGENFTATSNVTNVLVSSLHPAYTYQCSIAAYTVALGPFSEPFNITTDEDVPNQSPQNVIASSVLPESIYFTWNPPLPEHQNGVIVGYDVNLTTNSTNVIQNYSTGNTYIDISGLSPFTEYTCVVAARTTVGVGPFSLPLRVTSGEAAPSAAPVVTDSFVINSTAVYMEWEPPAVEYRHGIIREYRVNILAVDTEETTSLTFSSANATIGSLIPSFTYNFTVAAHTVETGPYSTIVTLEMPENAPTGYPQSIGGIPTNPYYFVLTWSPPIPREQGGEITRYVINVTNSDNNQTIQYFTSLTNINITGLNPYAVYVCVVAAENSIGIGPFSDEFTFQTLQGLLIFQTRIPSSINETVGMQLLINCSAKGHPTPTLMWYKDGSVIESGSRVSVIYNNDQDNVNESTLAVTSLVFDDTGLYECVAVNILTLDNITQSLALEIVGDPVRFTTEIPDEIVGQYGESVSVNCSASGSPTPILKWYRNGIEQCSSANIIIEDTLGSTEAQSILTITFVSERDEATYNCTAMNTLLSGNVTETASFDLRVLGSANTGQNVGAGTAKQSNNTVAFVVPLVVLLLIVIVAAVIICILCCIICKKNKKNDVGSNDNLLQKNSAYAPPDDADVPDVPDVAQDVCVPHDADSKRLPLVLTIKS